MTSSIVFLFFIYCFFRLSHNAVVPIISRAENGCGHYTIINTRGTNEVQGESIAVRSMNQKVMSAVPGGVIVNTVYSADNTQNMPKDSAAILQTIKDALSKDPNDCLVLEGFSQGAAATTYSMPKIDDSTFEQIKAVILIGNPLHHANSPSDVISQTGSGVMSTQGSIPSSWTSKTLDICNAGDPICQGTGKDWSQHGEYASDEKIQQMAADFIIKALKQGGNAGSTDSTSTSTSKSSSNKETGSDSSAASSTGNDPTTEVNAAPPTTTNSDPPSGTVPSTSRTPTNTDPSTSDPTNAADPSTATPNTSDPNASASPGVANDPNAIQGPMSSPDPSSGSGGQTSSQPPPMMIPFPSGNGGNQQPPAMPWSGDGKKGIKGWKKPKIKKLKSIEPKKHKGPKKSKTKKTKKTKKGKYAKSGKKTTV